MLNRRHIRTIVIQSIYSNSVELIDHSTLKTHITKSSSTTLDLFYCMIDFIKEINLYFNNIYLCSLITQLIAYRLCHFGLNPISSLMFFVPIIFIMLSFYIFLNSINTFK